MHDSDYDIIIIGSGMAGASAALAAKNQNKSVLIVEKGSTLG